MRPLFSIARLRCRVLGTRSRINKLEPVERTCAHLTRYFHRIPNPLQTLIIGISSLYFQENLFHHMVFCTYQDNSVVLLCAEYRCDRFGINENISAKVFATYLNFERNLDHWNGRLISTKDADMTAGTRHVRLLILLNETWTKWLPFCRRHYQMHFCEIKHMNLESKLIEQFYHTGLVDDKSAVPLNSFEKLQFSR